jgi:hypothetical protein
MWLRCVVTKDLVNLCCYNAMPCILDIECEWGAINYLYVRQWEMKI